MEFVSRYMLSVRIYSPELISKAVGIVTVFYYLNRRFNFDGIMKRLSSFILIISVVFGFTNAQASVAKRWTEHFVQNNSQFQALSEGLEASRDEYKAEVSSAFPDIEFSAARIKQKPSSFDPSPEDLYSASINLTQPIYLGGRVWRGIEIRDSNAKRVQLENEFKQQELIKEFLKLAIDWSLSAKRLETLKTSIKFQKTFVNITKKKLNRGNARAYEYHQNKANLLSYQSRYLELEDQVERLKDKLVALLETDLESLGPLVKVEVDSRFIGDQQKLLDQALVKNKNLGAQREQVKLAELNKSFAFGAHLPSVVLTGSYGYSVTDKADLFDSDFKTEKVTLGLTIPIFSGLSSMHERRANSHLIVQAEKGLKAALLSTKAGILSALKSYETAKDVNKTSKDWDRSATAAFKDGRKNFNVGAIGNAQMVQLQIGREQARLSLLESQKNLKIAVLELALLVGEDLTGLIK